MDCRRTSRVPSCSSAGLFQPRSASSGRLVTHDARRRASTAFWGMKMSQPYTGVNFVVSRLLGVIAGLLALATTISLPAMAADNGAAKWKVWSYNPSNRALRGSVPANANAGIATFPFPATPDVALLVTDHGSYKGSLLGDLTGRTVSASVSAAGGPFTYYGQ